MPPTHKLDLNVDYSTNLQFRWQMRFNRFAIENTVGGRTALLSFVAGDATQEIVPVFITDEGLMQLKTSVKEYLPGFSDTEDPGPEVEKLPIGVRRFSPLFSNHVRLARSGENAEISFYTLMLTFIADEVRGIRKKNSPMPLVPVALVHSSLPVHFRLLCRLLDGVKELPV